MRRRFINLKGKNDGAVESVVNSDDIEFLSNDVAFGGMTKKQLWERQENLTARLSKPRPIHKDYSHPKDPQWTVKKATLSYVPTNRIIELSKHRDESDIRGLLVTLAVRPKKLVGVQSGVVQNLEKVFKETVTQADMLMRQARGRPLQMDMKTKRNLEPPKQNDAKPHKEPPKQKDAKPRKEPPKQKDEKPHKEPSKPPHVEPPIMILKAPTLEKNVLGMKTSSVMYSEPDTLGPLRKVELAEKPRKPKVMSKSFIDVTCCPSVKRIMECKMFSDNPRAVIGKPFQLARQLEFKHNPFEHLCIPDVPKTGDDNRTRAEKIYDTLRRNSTLPSELIPRHDRNQYNVPILCAKEDSSESIVRVKKVVLPYKCSQRTERLAVPRKVHPEFQMPFSVPRPIPGAVLRVGPSRRIQALSQPRYRFTYYDITKAV